MLIRQIEVQKHVVAAERDKLHELAKALFFAAVKCGDEDDIKYATNAMSENVATDD